MGYPKSGPFFRCPLGLLPKKGIPWTKKQAPVVSGSVELISFVLLPNAFFMHRWRTSRSRSFRNAFRGIWFNLRNEPNFLIQLSVALLVVVAGILLTISRAEWIMVIISIGAVLTAEAMNTAVEKICDRFMDARDPLVRNIKDSAAAAVLIISITAALVGIMVFWPHAREFFVRM